MTLLGVVLSRFSVSPTVHDRKVNEIYTHKQTLVEVGVGDKHLVPKGVLGRC